MLYCWCKCRGCTDYWASRVSPWSLQTHGQWPAQGGTVVTTPGSYPTIPGACTCTFDINISCMSMSGWTLIIIQIYKNPLYAFVLINTRWHSEIWQLLYPDSFPGQISQHDPDNLDIMHTDLEWIISLLFGSQGTQMYVITVKVQLQCELMALVSNFFH